MKGLSEECGFFSKQAGGYVRCDKNVEGVETEGILVLCTT